NRRRLRMEAESNVLCVMLFKNRAGLKKAAAECKQAAREGVGFKGFIVKYICSIWAENVRTPNEGELHVLSFYIACRDKESAKDEHPELLRWQCIVGSYEDVIFWLPTYGTACLDKLAKPEDFSRLNARTAGA